jgi:hypothetical protein
MLFGALCIVRPAMSAEAAEIADLVTGLGVSFDKFRAWASEKFEGGGDWIGFESIPEAVGKTILRARARFMAQMEELR